METRTNLNRNEKEPVRMLIVEDGVFGDYLSEVTYLTREQIKDSSMFKLSDEEVDSVYELHESFPERLKDTLNEKGYDVDSVDVRTNWTTDDDPAELDNYNVIIGDLSYINDNPKLEVSEFERNLTNTSKGIEKVVEALESNRDDNVSSQLQCFGIYQSLKTLSKGELPREYERPDKVNMPTAESYEFFRQCKDKGKDVTAYTSDLGHTCHTLPCLLTMGAIEPEGVADAFRSADLTGKELAISENGRFAVGRKNDYDSWVKVAEAAIKYQYEY